MKNKKLRSVLASVTVSPAARVGTRMIEAAVAIVIATAAVITVFAVHGWGKWYLVEALGIVVAAVGGYEIARSLASQEETSSPVIRTYPNQADTEFRRVLDELSKSAKHMVFVGLGLAILSDSQWFEELCERATLPGVDIKICLMDPGGVNIVARLADEHVLQKAQPEVGLAGLQNRARTLIDTVRRFAKDGKIPDVSVMVYDRYPTVSSFILDDDVFVLFYGHTMNGHRSPVLQLRSDTLLSNYFRTNAEDIVRDSVPVSEVFEHRHLPSRHSADWHASAVFFVPDKNSQLYDFLSQLLGWDIWADQPTNISREYRQRIPDAGMAKYYGAHVTVADAAYFCNELAIERLARQLELLTQRYSPFRARLGETLIEHRSPGGLAIAVDDIDGGFELLHYELLGSSYRSAISSEFLRQASDGGLQARSQRDIQTIALYGSPYVMKEYRPHFTLTEALPDSGPERDSFLELVSEMRKEIPNDFRVESVVLARRMNGKDYWSVVETFDLTAR